ncbi:TPA: protein LphB [Legionella pneumophila]|uniref:Protein LphB n=2 Tax=Legionella pneumophila TaxID=446 RepID=A0A2S6F238_LEGPN|nr:protein LphB [Legionella pneumophila]TIH04021.1 protein LphB [Legionella pneumophila]HAT1894284.1 protein LphB [Legionella pneumophila]HAT1922080.1 protein LphB [Legionella pneumophila]HAT1943501.1 protein LphB [Legionella pneumophila]
MVLCYLDFHGIELMSVKWRWYDSLFILLFVYLLVLQIQAIWPFTIDDMYISLRYAKNWAAGNGLLWNLNAEPVEGYSNFSFVVLGAISIVLHINPVLTLKIAGFAGLLITCLFIFLISRFWFAKRESLIPCIWLLLYKGQIIWSVSGFEMTVYQALISGSVYFAFRGLGYHFYPASRGTFKTSGFIMSGLFLSLAGMTRPETPALMLLFFLLISWDQNKLSGKRPWRGAACFAATILLVFVPYFLWRWNYYGLLFPNSVYCKGFNGISYSLDLNYLKLIWPFAILAFPACFYAQDRRHYFLWSPSIIYLLMLSNADPIVAFENRLFLPAFALMLPLTWQGISHLLLRYFKKQDHYFKAALYVSAFFLALLFIPKMSLGDYRYFSQNPVHGEQLRISVVQWLNTHARSQDKVVLADSGLIPFLSELTFIDSYCLNNKKMAQFPVVNRYELFCHQILEENPSIIILTSLTDKGEVIYTPGDACLKPLLDDNKKYKLSGVFSFGSADSQYRYELFANF